MGHSAFRQPRVCRSLRFIPFFLLAVAGNNLKKVELRDGNNLDCSVIRTMLEQSSCRGAA